MQAAAHALTQQFLAWVAEGERRYADAEDWRRSCPHLSIWEDAIADHLIRFERGAGLKGARIVLTELGRKRLNAEAAVTSPAARRARHTSSLPAASRPLASPTQK